MCRLFGLVANRPVDVEFSMLTGSTTMRNLSESHPDGWGIGWYDEKGIAKVKKEPLKAKDSTRFPDVVAEVRAHLIIGHVRKASVGKKSKENCHPFMFKNWLFAHNGTVHHRKSLLEKLNNEHKSAIEGETDSKSYERPLPIDNLQA